MKVAVHPKVVELFLGTSTVRGQERARKQLAVLLDRQLGVREGRYKRASGAIIAGWTGCVGGETLIDTDAGPRPIRELAGRIVNVVTPNGLRPASVFLKGEAMLYRIQHQEGVFRGTANHRVLVATPRGADWKAISEVTPGELLYASSSTHRASNWADVPEACPTDGRSWSHTPSDSRSRCWQDRRRYDEQPLNPAMVVRGSAPLSFGAQGHTLFPQPTLDDSPWWWSTPSSRSSSWDPCSPDHWMGGYPLRHCAIESTGKDRYPKCDISPDHSRQLLSGSESWGEAWHLSRIEACTATSYERYYDMSILSGPPIYRAAGVWHHNTGKTMLARMMCEMSGLPFAEVNATQYTESGYAGEDLSQMFLPLLEAAARIYDGGRTTKKAPTDSPLSVLKRPAPELREIVAIAESGVLLLDEFDKWMQRVNHVTGRLDTAVQAELLKMVEGGIVYISDDEDEIGVPFDTTKVLILCAGAFVGLARQVAKRLQLASDGWEHNESLWEHIEPDDFIRFGVIPELAGRLSTHVFLRPLKPETMVEIMSAPGGIVEEYRSRFEAAGVEWGVSEHALRTLADQALRRDIGARGIEHMMWGTFGEALFTAASSEGGGKVAFEVNEKKARVV